jgi:signal transduction histidine kinase
MKKIVAVLIGSFFLVGIMISIGSASSKEEAKAMVEKAVAFYKANGKEKTFAEVSNLKGQFIKGDLYVFVYDLTGKCVAHGQNKVMIGKDLAELKDPDGKYFVKERLELAKTKGKGWQDYKFTHPITKKVEQKVAWIEKVDEYIFGCGAYK